MRRKRAGAGEGGIGIGDEGGDGCRWKSGSEECPSRARR